jgi:hypothetical protein
VSLVFLILLAAFSRASPLSADELETTLKAWQARQERFRSLRVEWHSHLLGMPFAMPLVKGGIPGRNKTEEKLRRHTLVIDGDKMLYIEEVVGRSTDNREVSEHKEISSFDGTVSKSLWLRGADLRPVQGNIHAEKYCNARSANDIKPIIWTFRPLDPHAGGRSRDTLVLHSPAQRLDGRECIVVKDKRFPTRSSLSYVSASMHFSPVRVTVTSPDGAEVFNAHDVSYEEHDANDVLVPVRWVTTSYGDKANVRERVSATVDHFELNPAVDPSEFQIQFPPGTNVVDMRARNKPRRKPGLTAIEFPAFGRLVRGD